MHETQGQQGTRSEDHLVIIDHQLRTKDLDPRPKTAIFLGTMTCSRLPHLATVPLFAGSLDRFLQKLTVEEPTALPVYADIGVEGYKGGGLALQALMHLI